ncbi:LOW QUALITY PROTEIN: hypothetical protein TorRG33x02_101670 [Trema orientale]|uniref:Uncharacterized protein n=1 Tax=Trema orientale TaxID=63057 RepID=A0A2P5F8L4_TREOI|nr:LOW QUALITY PROTEIN: hypothetical protein TorRG33x02_101670 [Trema orientale]
MKAWQSDSGELFYLRSSLKCLLKITLTLIVEQPQQVYFSNKMSSNLVFTPLRNSQFSICTQTSFNNTNRCQEQGQILATYFFLLLNKSKTKKKVQAQYQLIRVLEICRIMHTHIPYNGHLRTPNEVG